jgi:hypothetical protein
VPCVATSTIVAIFCTQPQHFSIKDFPSII